MQARVPVALPLVTALCACAGGLVCLLGKVRQALRSRSAARVALGALSLLFSLIQFGFAFFRVSYAVYGYAVMAYVYAFVILCMAFDRRASHLPFFLALGLIGIYMLGVKVHERYLLPALPLLLAAYVLVRDRRCWRCLPGYPSRHSSIQLSFWTTPSSLAPEMGHLNSDTLALNDVLCVCNLALCGYAFWLAWTGLRESDPIRIEEAEKAVPPSYEQMLLAPRDASLHLKLRDYLVMGATCLVYGALAFTNLGSTVAPQTGWVSTSPDEQIVFDLARAPRFASCTSWREL